MITKKALPKEISNFKVQWGPIGQKVYERSYSLEYPDGTRETWPETVVRVVDGNLGFVDKKYIEKDEREKLINLILNFGFVPAGRHLNATGVKGRQFVHNCHTSAFDPNDAKLHYTFMFDQLMQGGGVGCNYSNRYTDTQKPVSSTVDLHIVCREDHSNIDEFKDLLSTHISSKEAEVFNVEDSRDGWVDAISRLLHYSFERTSPGSLIIDVSAIRKRGDLLKTSGGRACGPGPLVKLLFNAAKILNSCYGRKLSSLETMELDHAIADCVVAGGKRRSSRMSIKNWKDPDIFEFINCKKIDGTHWTTNISIEVDDEFFAEYANGNKHARDVMRETVLAMRLNGEPGFWNISLSRTGEKEPEKIFSTNPCQPGRATVLTKDGVRTFNDIKAGSVIWSGKKWTTVVRKLHTGIKKVKKYITTAGYFLGTDEHRVMQEGERVEARKAERIDVAIGEVVEGVGEVDNQDVIDGLVIGDGTVHKASGNLVLLLIGDNDQDYFKSEIAEKIIEHRPGIKNKSYEIDTTITSQELPRTYERRVPTRFKTGGRAKVCGFLRGLFSANGSVIDGSRVSLKTSSRLLAEDVQEMLSSVGILSYRTTNKKHTVVFENGDYECRESYDVNITSDRDRFIRHIGFIQKYKNDKLNGTVRSNRGKKTFEIVEILDEGDDDVYDITVDADEHTYWTGGLLVSNCGEIALHAWEPCNLGHINLEYFATKPRSEVLEAFRLAARWLLRATFSDIPQKVQREVVDRNRRVGVGFFGFHAWLAFNSIKYSECYDNERVKSLLSHGRKEVARELASYSSILSIPTPVKCTTIAPTGTTAMLPGTTTGSQALLFKRFKRLVNYSSNDPLLKVLKEEGYEVIKNKDAQKTESVVYWCEDPLVTKLTNFGFENIEDLVENQDDVSFETSLKVQAMLQEVYADNAISYTINLKKSSMPSEEEMEKLLIEFLPKLKGTTIFPEMSRSDAPIQPVSLEDWRAFKGRKEVTMIEEECKGGCPIK